MNSPIWRPRLTIRMRAAEINPLLLPAMAIRTQRQRGASNAQPGQNKVTHPRMDARDLQQEAMAGQADAHHVPEPERAPQPRLEIEEVRQVVFAPNQI